MIRKFKTLGLALVAVFAMSAFVASAASATEFTAEEGNYPVTYTGVQPANDPHVFKADGFTVECDVAHFEGTQNEESTTATVAATYDECFVGTIGATVHMNSCDYMFNLPAVGNNATVDVECPTGKEITITAGLCVIHVPPQKGLSHVNMSNNGTHVDAKPTISGITSNLTDGFLCPFNGNTHDAAGTLTGGAVTLIGQEEGIDVG